MANTPSRNKTNKKEIAPQNKKAGAISKTKKKTLKKPITLIIILLLLIGVIAGCLISPTFNISEIIINDGENIKKEQINEKVSEIIGNNIFQISKGKYEKLIKELPYIKEVNIQRKLPNRIKIKYEERIPYAIIKYLESYVIMDKHGYILEIQKENNHSDLPIIYGVSNKEYILGGKLSGTAELKYENIAYLLETAKQIEFSYTIYEINCNDTEHINLSIKEEDIEINYGEIDREILREKLIYTEEVLKMSAGKLGTLDMSRKDYRNKTIFKERY